jgi:aldehyde:ferredoxin oxidoreductase
VGKLKLVKAKKRCCKSRPRCKKCPVVCKRLADEGLAVRQDRRHYLVELPIGKKALKAARAR